MAAEISWGEIMPVEGSAFTTVASVYGGGREGREGGREGGGNEAIIVHQT